MHIVFYILCSWRIWKLFPSYFLIHKSCILTTAPREFMKISAALTAHRDVEHPNFTENQFHIACYTGLAKTRCANKNMLIQEIQVCRFNLSWNSAAASFNSWSWLLNSVGGKSLYSLLQARMNWGSQSWGSPGWPVTEPLPSPLCLHPFPYQQVTAEKPQ